MAETAVIMPVLLICMFGAIDLGLLLWQWNTAAKATHFGARHAVVANAVAVEDPAFPIATGIQHDVNWGVELGALCRDAATGTYNPDCGSEKLAFCHGLPGGGGRCCTAANWSETTQSCSSQSGSYAFHAPHFDLIVNGDPEGGRRRGMREIFPDLRWENVRISYAYDEDAGLGFVGNPFGTPMVVSVGIRCRTYEFVLLDALLGWVLPPNLCGQQYGRRGVPMPAFLTAYSSESLISTKDFVP